MIEQIPKEFRTNKSQYKSPWAIIIIIVVFILFGLFWFFENENESSPIVSSMPQPQQMQPRDITSDLEASVGSIEIPNYSDSL